MYTVGAIIVGLLIVGGTIGLFSSQPGGHEGSEGHLSLVGHTGVAQNTFVEEGMILINGELWKAESRQGIIEKGSSVEVIEMLPGLRVLVKGLAR